MAAAERTVGILAFDAMEVLDYAGPYEVFGVAGHRVVSIGVDDGPAVGRNGFQVLPDTTIAEAQVPDILVVPGGAGTRPLLREEALLDWVRTTAGRAELVLSVCTGALVLAAAGLLDGREATTHHGAFGELAALSPSTTIVRGQRFVQSSDRIWTSAGVSAGVDLSLHVVGLVDGEATRDEVVEEMEWGW